MIWQVFLLTFISNFFSILVQSMGSVIDGFIVGQNMSIDDVSASTVTAPLWFLIAMGGNLICKGGQFFAAEELSKGRSEEANDIVSMAFTSVLVFTTVTMSLLLVFSHPLTVFLGLDPSQPAFASCRNYLCGAAFGLPGMALFAALSANMQLLGSRKQVVFGVLAMTVSDLVLDLVVVFVLHGGMLLIGLATAISYYVGALALVPYSVGDGAGFKIRFRIPGKRLLAGMLKRGLPLAVSRMTSSWKSLYINHLLAAFLSSVGLAAYHVQVQTNYVLNAVIMGLAQTLGLMSGIYYAEEDEKALKKTVFCALSLHLVISGCLILLFLFDTPLMFLIRFFLGEKEEAFFVTKGAMRFYFFSILGTGLAVILANYLQATKRIFMSAMVYVFDDILLVFLGVLAAGQFTARNALDDQSRMIGVFAGLMVGQILMILIIPAVISIVNRKISFRRTSFLMLPEGFGTAEGEDLSGAISSVEEVVAFSETAHRYCLDRNVPARTANLVALSCEEMGKNVIQYGFVEGKKNYLEIRIVIRAEEIVIRFRDNCRSFNPKKFYENVYDQNEPLSNFGIRMIMKLSKEVSYTSVLKLNNLMIRL